MPPFGPITRANLIRAFASIGICRTFPVGRHAFMFRGERRLAIPNPHPGEIGVNLLGAYSSTGWNQP